MDKLPIFRVCSHLQWGLWGIIRGSSLLESDFDYISYGLHRLHMYAEEIKEILTHE